ncbi:MAG: chorismate-binding protein [Akkermansiaceae bacterium]
MNTSKERLAWLTRTDGTVVVGRGPFREVPEPPASGVAFFKQSFKSDKKNHWQLPETFEIYSVEEFRGAFAAGELPLIDWESPDAVPFSEVFQEIMSAIRQGSIEKTVPVVTERGRSQGSPVAGIVAAMAAQSAPLHSYGWVGPDEGFSGATPELLISMRGCHLETMALAGTAKQEDEAVFSVDEKEIREHEYVAQTLVAKLHDLGDLERKNRSVLRLGSIVHFHTGISVDLDTPQQPESLVQRLHPTPALGPLPRTNQSLAMLAGLREQLACPAEFGAPFGVWENGSFEAVIAIRGIWWQGNDLFLPAGCGIIEPSRLVNEWRELRLKREAVKRFLV